MRVLHGARVPLLVFERHCDSVLLGGELRFGR